MSTEPIAPSFDAFSAARAMEPVGDILTPGVPRDSDASELLDLREMAARYQRRHAEEEEATPIEMLDTSAVLITKPHEHSGPTWSLAVALAVFAFALGIVVTLAAHRFAGDGGPAQAAVDQPAVQPAVPAVDDDQRVVSGPAAAELVPVAAPETSEIDEPVPADEPAPAIDAPAAPSPRPPPASAASASRAEEPEPEPASAAEPEPEPEPASAGEPAAPPEPPATTVETAPATDSCTEVDCLLDPGLACCPEPEPEAEDAVADAPPDLRDRPTASELQAAMAPLKNGVWTCADRSGLDGVVNVRLLVAPDGTIEPTVTRGPDAFKQCVATLIRRVRLEPSRNGMAGAYPFIIR